MNEQYKSFYDRFMTLYEEYSDSTFLDYYRFNSKLNNKYNHPYFMIDEEYIKLFLDEIFSDKEVIYGIDAKNNCDLIRDLKCDKTDFMHIFEMVKYQFRKHWLYKKYSDKKNILDSEVSCLDLYFVIKERIIEALKNVYDIWDESTKFSIADLMVIDEEVLNDSLFKVAAVNSMQAINKIKKALAIHDLYLYDELPSEKMTIVDCIKKNLYKGINADETPISVPSFGKNVNYDNRRWNYTNIDDTIYELGILYSDEFIGELLDTTKETVFDLDNNSTLLLRKKLGVFDNGKRCKYAEIDSSLNITGVSCRRAFNRKINSWVRSTVERQIPVMLLKKQQDITKLNISARLFNRLYSNNVRYISELKNVTIEELQNVYGITGFLLLELLSVLKESNIYLKEKIKDNEDDLNCQLLSVEDAHVKKIKRALTGSIWK